MKVSELSGPLLDYWVARAIGVIVRPGLPRAMSYDVPFDIGPPDSDHGDHFEPSARWGHGGPLIESERIMLDGDLTLDVTAPSAFQWSARIYGEGMAMSGPEPLIAAMRALVVSKLGEEVGDD